MTSSSFDWKRQMHKPIVNIDHTRVCRVAYPDVSLNQDIKRLRALWNKVQADRHRDAIFDYLSGVYEVIEWWTAEGRAIDRARKALRVNGLVPIEEPEPFAAVIAASVAPGRLDRRQLSKYARALRYAAVRECRAKKLKGFIKDRGGINGCAARFNRRLRRQRS